jgi:HlyD family secretion protein
MRRIWWVVLAVALVAAAGAYYVLQVLPSQSQPQVVRTGVVSRQDIVNTVSASGSLQAMAQVSLVFVTPGRVARVDVRTGDRVVAGQVLALLDSTDLELAVDQAQQALLVQQLTVAGLTAEPGETDLAAAQAGLDAAQARLVQSKSGTSRDQIESARLAVDLAWNAYLQADVQRNAVQDNPFTPADERAQFDASAGMAYVNWQIAQRQYALARKGPSAAGIASAQAGVVQAQALLSRLQEGARASDVRSAQLQLVLAENRLARTKSLVENAVLTTPRPGVIAAVNVKVGDSVPGSMPAIVLVDDDAFHLDISVDEVDVARLSVNLPVSITLDALQGVELSGKIAEISPLATNTGGVISYAVRVDLQNNDPRVRAGMTASATVVTEEHEDVLVVPNWAVRIDRETGQAYVPVRRGGQVSEVPVTLGLRNENVSEVLSGVGEGEELVLIAQGSTLFGNP